MKRLDVAIRSLLILSFAVLVFSTVLYYAGVSIEIVNYGLSVSMAGVSFAASLLVASGKVR